jgi:hypothetical protein
MIKRSQSKKLDKHLSISGFSDTLKTDRYYLKRSVSTPSVERLLNEGAQTTTSALRTKCVTKK